MISWSGHLLSRCQAINREYRFNAPTDASVVAVASTSTRRLFFFLSPHSNPPPSLFLFSYSYVTFLLERDIRFFRVRRSPYCPTLRRDCFSSFTEFSADYQLIKFAHSATSSSSRFLSSCSGADTVPHVANVPIARTRRADVELASRSSRRSVNIAVAQHAYARLRSNANAPLQSRTRLTLDLLGRIEVSFCLE